MVSHELHTHSRSTQPQKNPSSHDPTGSQIPENGRMSFRNMRVWQRLVRRYL